LAPPPPIRSAPRTAPFGAQNLNSFWFSHYFPCRIKHLQTQNQKSFGFWFPARIVFRLRVRTCHGRGACGIRHTPGAAGPRSGMGCRQSVRGAVSAPRAGH
jgi:hypothetical protein